MTRRLTILLIAVLTAGALLIGYRFLRASVEVAVYRQRLARLGADYERLRDTYNRAVRRTAVTELLVENGTLCVIIRTAEGELKRIPTPFNPRREIYVDFVVLDGRLWIRRVFDEATPPDRGVVIDPGLVSVDWGAQDAATGKATYRQLSDGRWAVSVSGDGSLTLDRVDPATELELVRPPRIARFEPDEQEAAEADDRVGVMDVLRRLVEP